MILSLVTSTMQLIAKSATDKASAQISTSIERLSTGLRINSAKDDPAGLIAVQSLKSHISDTEAKIAALTDQDHYLGARDGGQQAIGDELIDLQGLVVRAASGAALSDDEKHSLQIQADSIIAGINYLSQTATYKGQQILTGFDASKLGTHLVDGPAGAVDADGNAAQVSVSLADLGSGKAFNLVTGDLESAQKTLSQAILDVSSSTAAIGARSKALNDQINELQNERINTEAARSQIEDTDYAEETSKLVRAQLLQQAGEFMQAFAAQEVKSMTQTLLKDTAKAAS